MATENEILQEIKDELSSSCALPYSLNETEMKRIIKRARGYFYDNYQYAVEDKIFVLDNAMFGHPSFRATRQIQLPDCVVAVYELREVNGSGLTGTIDRDFSDSKLLGSELMLSPFMGDNLVYRTILYSFFDLARAYLLETYAYSYNKNTHRLTILGRDPQRASMGQFSEVTGRDVAVKGAIAIPPESLYDDELFVRYVLAEAKINLGRLLGVFNYNLPGNITVNFSAIKTDGETEKTAILQQIQSENSTGYFIQWN